MEYPEKDTEKVVRDMLGYQIGIGDMVAAATLSYGTAHLRVGCVMKFTEKGSITIQIVPATKGARHTAGRGTKSTVNPRKSVVLRGVGSPG